MKIVAFLQNCWFPPGTNPRHINMYNEDVNFRRRVLAGTMSGGRIRIAFGPWLYDRVYWDNASLNVANRASGVFEADLGHMLEVVKSQRPRLIVTFGRIAENGIKLLQEEEQIDPGIEHFACHHPNARFRTQAQLDGFGRMVWNWVESHVGATRERIERGEVCFE